ncbi:transcriptional regulator, NifA subfamily, Fis family [Stigmatella aurantiaca]|uniref:Transcriptional regulator, NifA subfamily, Fis family n=1 Tax=Stigmatella aurantiaca TaxID=41 RepID=A0A1H7JB40_STIAU|nr:sigma 54-interacting transcriptional regulator [Stigmatella aurantiaca]SEK71230.1 transcriptional regulator, NifA subfamily, Fis family [Stigmatella aurantiaca]
MASLSVRTPDGKVRTVPLLKRITSIGRGPDNDVPLDDPAVPDSALHVLFDGSRYQVGSLGATFQINGKKRDSHVLASQDVIRVGQTELTFSRDTSAPRPIPSPAPTITVEENPDSHTAELPGVPGRELAMLRRLTAFSERLLGSYDLDRILESLMDEAIEVTRADKGFLILMESNEPRVKVARNLSRENIEDAVEKLSDSIIAKVVKEQKPLILADAIDAPEFKASESVVNLKVHSVMCVPLMHKGSLFGLIYVGNDRLVNRFEPKSLDMLTIFAAQASLILHNALLVNDLKLDNTELRKKLEDQRYGDIIGACQGMKEVYKRIDKIALTDISVLITGETGTGKELIAREIHRHSPRAKGPFITINCGAIPENLLESELFGHVKGAFTGAVATRPGKFQAAIGGTLFLDEIGELPLQLQVKLLRALQEKVVYKVGDNRGEPVDIRVVAATNKVLEEEVKRSTFREDLYYRLNVVTLKLPPLRERGEDVQVLGKFFLQKYSKEFNSKVRGFTPAATVAMKKYAWPGNIRELENRIKKASVLADKPLLGADDLDLKPENLEPIMPLLQAKEEFQKRYINEVLARNNGNRTKTAKDLGVDPRTIFRHLEKMEAEKSGRPLPPEEEEF